MVEQQTTKIYDMLKNMNNPKLVDRSKSPNENTIYHLYNDGEITSQKGGEVYGHRNEHCHYPYDSIYFTRRFRFDVDKFPFTKITDDKIKFGYAILTLDDATLIRNEMLELAKLLLL